MILPLFENMKNLVVHQLLRRHFPLRENVEKDNCQLPDVNALKFAVNANNGNLYILSDSRIIVLPIYSEDDIIVQDVAICKNSNVVGFEYCITTQLLYCATGSGDVITVDTTNAACPIEVVATFDSGLLCMKLSPDQEIITMVTGSGTVITMVAEYEDQHHLLGFQLISEVKFKLKFLISSKLLKLILFLQ